MVISPIVIRIFTEEESRDILQFLKEKTIAYHRPYKYSLTTSKRQILPQRV